MGLWRDGIVLAALTAVVTLTISIFMVRDHLANVVALYEVSREAVVARDAVEGSYVHVSGIPDVENPAVDPVTGVAGRAVAMRRDGRIFQWVEYRRLVGKGGTIAEHMQKWVPSTVDASKFSREGLRKGLLNVGTLELTNKILEGRATLDGLTIDPRFFARLSIPWMDRRLSIDEFNRIPTDVRSGFSLVNGVMSQGGESENGATRVSYQLAPPREVSLVGVVRQGSVEPIVINGDDAGLVVEGKQSLGAMLWEKAWPSLLKVMIAAFVCVVCLALPVLSVYDVVVEERESKAGRLPEG